MILSIWYELYNMALKNFTCAIEYIRYDTNKDDLSSLKMNFWTNLGFLSD